LVELDMCSRRPPSDTLLLKPSRSWPHFTSQYSFNGATPSVFHFAPSSVLNSPPQNRHSRNVDSEAESRLWLIPLACLLLSVPLHPAIGSRSINIAWTFGT
jgi:hypothetical protein